MKVTWTYEVYDDVSPEKAALHVWRDVLGMGIPYQDDPCIFEVTDDEGVTHTVDLSDLD